MFTFFTFFGNGILNPEKVYGSIMMLGFVKIWCIVLPHVGRIFIVNFKVILKRVQDILLIPDVYLEGKGVNEKEFDLDKYDEN